MLDEFIEWHEVYRVAKTASDIWCRLTEAEAYGELRQIRHQQELADRKIAEAIQPRMVAP